jgi:hypothetical protein
LPRRIARVAAIQQNERGLESLLDEAQNDVGREELQLDDSTTNGSRISIVLPDSSSLSVRTTS